MRQRSHFRFAADILRRLGEELNPGADQSILELVKNAYDADATTCTIRLTNTEQAGGKIEIIDDGDGMTDADLVDGWLVLGHSRKTGGKPTRLGRYPAGSKGLGRLAALRMGETAFVSTQSRKRTASRFELSIDWNCFDAVELVDDVNLPIRRMKRGGKGSGTTIVLDQLREPLSRVDVKKLARSLVLLADPFGEDPSGFHPKLIAPEFEDLEKSVANRYFDDADFHLVAKLGKTGLASAKVVDHRGQILFSAKHHDLTQERKGARYASPPAELDVWIFILDGQNFVGRRSVLRDVRPWLNSFGGVHLYQNGIRVAPYGNSGNDWLDLNLRRARSPEERPSTNTLIGKLTVTDSGKRLAQKTDRSGFIENESFLELRSFAVDAMEWLARRRMEVAEKRRSSERNAPEPTSTEAKRNVVEAISKAPSESQEQLKEVFAAYERERERESENLKREVQLYRTLSTTGITAATFSHESSGNPVKVITHSIGAIQRRAQKALGNDYERLLMKPVGSIVRAADTLGVLSSTTLSLIDHEKRRLTRVNIHRVISNVYELFEPFFRGRSVECQLELSLGEPWLRASEAAVESVVTNLLNNSLAAFETAGSKSRRILVRTSYSQDDLLMVVSDSGPGIQGIALRDIWLPGVTTRPHGTGLGLTIVKDTVNDLGGRVNAVEHGALGGAEISVRLPILGSQ